VTPKPILSVEFQKGKELLVWRVEINSTKPASETAIGLKTKYPQYLGKVPLSQVHRLVKFCLSTTRPSTPSSGSELHGESTPNKLDPIHKDFIYDIQVDYGDMSKGKAHPFDDDTHQVN
jgi:hypothetical protein